MNNLGGWGGRFTGNKTLIPKVENFVYTDESPYKPFYGYEDIGDTWTYNGTTYASDVTAPVARWRVAFQNDMAARMNRSISSSFSAANHNPKAVRMRLCNHIHTYNACQNQAWYADRVNQSGNLGRERSGRGHLGDYEADAEATNSNRGWLCLLSILFSNV